MPGLIDSVGLDGAQHVKAANLSGGMRRRLDICCGLIHDPSIILLDEATSGLDAPLRREVWELILSLNHAGRTLIFTTHLLDEIHDYADRVAVLDAGMLVDSGSTAELAARYHETTLLRIRTRNGHTERIRSAVKEWDITTAVDDGWIEFILSDPRVQLPFVFYAIAREEDHPVDIEVQHPDLLSLMSKLHAEVRV